MQSAVVTYPPPQLCLPLLLSVSPLALALPVPAGHLHLHSQRGGCKHWSETLLCHCQQRVDDRQQHALQHHECQGQQHRRAHLHLQPVCPQQHDQELQCFSQQPHQERLRDVSKRCHQAPCTDLAVKAHSPPLRGRSAASSAVASVCALKALKCAQGMLHWSAWVCIVLAPIC